MAANSVFGTSLEFDDFLYAPLWGEVDQMPLSVLTALTRLNLDPWTEASALSQLPRETAIRRLAGLISRLPPMHSAKFDAAEAAVRLVDLLPSPPRSFALPGNTAVRIPLPLPAFRSVLLLAIIVGAMALLLAMAREHASQNAPSDPPPPSKSKHVDIRNGGLVA